MRNPHKPPEASPKDGAVQKSRHWGRMVHVSIAVSLLLLTVGLIFPGLHQSGVELSSVDTGVVLAGALAVMPVRCLVRLVISRMPLVNL